MCVLVTYFESYVRKLRLKHIKYNIININKRTKLTLTNKLDEKLSLKNSNLED